MNLSGLEIPGYIITLAVILISVYALYYLGSHRYQVIQEGFKLSQNPKEPDDLSKEELASLSPADIDSAAEKRDELTTKKDRISKLLDEAYEELNKNKHKEDYEEIINDLDELVDASILDRIMKNKDVLLSADLSDVKAMKEIEHITNLENFKGVLKNMTSVVRKH